MRNEELDNIFKLPDTLLEKASQLGELPLEEVLEILQEPISPDEVNAIKTVTTGQSMSAEWLGQRKGRITAPAECGSSTPVTCLFTSKMYCSLIIICRYIIYISEMSWSIWKI